MTTTVQFLNCFITKNGIKTNVSISDFLDGVITLDETSRYVEASYGCYSLIDMLMPTNNPNKNSLDRIVGFANYRDKKPFVGNRRTDKRGEIKGDIFELTSCLFIPTYHLAVIEYNHFGARPKNIERYLNAFLPKDPDNFWCFELIPIETQASFQDIRTSESIRSIEIKLDLLSSDIDLFTEQLEPQSISGRMLQNSINAYRSVGANVATINIGQGRYRSNPMEFDTLINMLNILDLEQDTFASVKVTYYSQITNKIEIVDLKNEGFLKRVILEENNSTAFESIGIGISNYYYENSGRLAKDHWQDLVQGHLVFEKLPVIKPYLEELSK